MESMETINEISNRFFLLRKRMRDDDINDLRHKSNRSFSQMLKRTQTKKGVDPTNSQLKLAPEHSKRINSDNKPEPPEISIAKSIEPQENNNTSSPQLDSMKKNSNNNKKVIKQKKPTKIKQLPADNLLNLAFNKDAMKNIPLPSAKPHSPKQKGKDSNLLLPLTFEKNSNSDHYNSSSKDMNNRSPIVIEDNVDHLSSNSIYKNKPISNNEDDDGNEGSNMDYYVKKEEIFDNNNILFNDDDSPEIKPFDEDDNKQCNYPYEDKNRQEDKESNDNRNIVNNKDTIKDIERKGDDNDNYQMNEENNVIIENSKVVIPLDAYMNLNKSNYMNEYKNNENENENVNMSSYEEESNQGDRKESGINNGSSLKNTNKIIDGNADKLYDNANEHEQMKYDVQDKKETGNNKEGIKDSPLVTIKGTQIKLNLKLDSLNKAISKKEKNEANIKITPSPHSNSRNKERKMSTSSSKAHQIKQQQSNHSNHNYHNSKGNTSNDHSRNKCIANKNNSNSTQAITNSNEGNKTISNPQLLNEFNQQPPLIHEIKKKEYDIVCLSMLESLFNKMKTKYTNSTNDSSSSSSSALIKRFEDINKILIQLNLDDPAKRVKHIAEKTMKILLILFDLLENEKKREFYLYDILQIIDVIYTFQHKAKINYGQKIPQWFKLIKLCFKYISSLFRIKGYSTNQLKDLVNQNDCDNRTRNLVKFTKCYKSFVTSVDKLKTLLLKNSNEDRKQKKATETLLIYLETNPSAIKYSKCFKVSKKFIEFIFDYLSFERIKE